MVEAPLPQHWRWESGWMDVNGRRWWNTLLVPFVNSLSSREVKCLIFLNRLKCWNSFDEIQKLLLHKWMTNSCNARSPVILCQVVHKKFSHSQFSQFGSRKGRNDSNLFDPSGSISLNTRDNAQALRLSLVDSIHCSDAMNLHGLYRNGSQLKWIKQWRWRTCLATGWKQGLRHACWGLSSAPWSKPGAKRFCEILFWTSEIFALGSLFCTVQKRQKQTKQIMNKNIGV